MSEPLIMRRARQREQLILALLQQPGMEKAAQSIGISGVTAWRISKTPGFQEEYRQAGREAFAQSLGSVFLAGVPLAVIALVLVCLIKEVPLRTRVAPLLEADDATGRAGWDTDTATGTEGTPLRLSPVPDRAVRRGTSP